MMILQDLIQRIQPLDVALLTQVRRRMDSLTKPVGSLGRLEELAVHYVTATGKAPVDAPAARLVTFAADHGITDEHVSAYPREVTGQMVETFSKGKAAVNILARHVGCDLCLVDVGVDADLNEAPGLINRKIARGTKSFTKGSAMDRSQAEAALTIGADMAAAAGHDGIGVLGTGELGIGNSTSAAAITAVMTEQPVETVTGRGAGLDEEGLKRKIAVIKRSLDFHAPQATDPVSVLASIGGFEIAALSGFILGAAAVRIPVVLDGFITGAAALVAAAIEPRCTSYMIASHCSAEPGHRPALDRLKLVPLLDLHLRLGEGTGACLGISLVQASVKLLTQMATFEEAGITPRHEGE